MRELETVPRRVELLYVRVPFLSRCLFRSLLTKVIPEGLRGVRLPLAQLRFRDIGMRQALVLAFDETQGQAVACVLILVM